MTKFVLKLGGYAEGVLGYYDLESMKPVFHDGITTVLNDLQELKSQIHGTTLNLRPPGQPHDTIWEETDQLWNYAQTMRFAAGISMIGLRFHDRMTPENRRRATVAKVLHQCQTGLLDDLIDTGQYSFIEAKNLYHHCLVSMIDPGFEVNKFRRELAVSLNQDQLVMFDLMTNITAAFNALYLESPHGQDLFYDLERLDQHMLLGQALTMFQKESRLDIVTLKRLSSSLYAPDPSIPWHDRISQCLSGGTYYNLIDSCFLTEPVTRLELDTTLNAWYYYDLVITQLNHIVGVYRDLKGGIANLALIAMRENELLGRTTLQGYSPTLTMRDYEAQLARSAEFSRRALSTARADDNESSLFYPFITLMIPVVMLADWIGHKDDLIHRYIGYIAPYLQQTVAEAAEMRRPVVVPAPVR